MRTILAVCQDLIFATKIRGTASELGVTCHVVPTGAEPRSDEVTLVLVDLNAPRTQPSDLADLRRTFSPPVKLIAFGSHVDVARLRTARDAGFDLVLPRSEFTKQLPTLMQEA